MNIAIVGCGKVGTALIEQLNKEGHDITAIDTNKDVVEAVVNKIDIMGVVGNGASYNIQIEAGIENTDLLIAVTGSDEVNLLCCLIAKKYGGCHAIARVRNPVYSQEISMLKDELGLSMIVNPEFAAANEIARVLRFPSAIKIDTFAKGRVELLKFRITSGSPLDNSSLIDISKRLKCDVLICAVERDDQVIIPNGSFVLKEKDIISIVASPNKASEFFKKMGIKTHQVKDTLIVGGGELTYYLARMLLGMGIDVTIIEQKRERCEVLSELLPKAIVINGDGIDQSLLQEEGLDSVESFVALTNLDEENIMLSLYAKSRTKAKIITKVNRITFDDVINQLDLGSIICPKHITAEYIVRYVRGMQNSIGSNIETLYKIIDNRAEALEFIVKNGSPLIETPLEKLNLKDNIIIACINRNGKIIIPNGQDVIREKDTVIVVTTITGLNDIRDILKS